ncbi:hypothetical protein AGOR_G00050460 [Albula goreensis]|uniref:Uncharacterized protein n=1 Tax=Albula goreensis TaxID=1534307 RepID=A0A8T3DST4_9TELE|nr:hypothetical protein AGOR_G00050460 [Albula goreensis]
MSPLNPRCKERLHMKYSKDKKNKQHSSHVLNTNGWRLLKPGLDDCRAGHPPPVGDHSFNCIQKGSSTECGCETKPRNHLTKEQVCFSKRNPQQQARLRHIAEVEYSLTQHPLALYPHLQESMPPELFEQVVSFLDPDIHMNSGAALTLMNMDKDNENDNTEQNEKSMQDVSKPNVEMNTMQSSSIQNGDPRRRNLYLHHLFKEKSSKDDQVFNGKWMQLPSLEDEIKKVEKQLHDWVIAWDGESVDLTKSTLLAGEFVRRSSLEPHSLPEDLCSSVEELFDMAKSKTALKAPDLIKSHSGKGRVNYRAPSQDTKTQKTRNMDQPARDSPFVTEGKDSVIPNKLDEELKHSYIAEAFKKFIVSKGLREPEVLHLLFSSEEKENRRNPRKTDTAG